MSIRDEADDLLDEADLYDDPNKPMHALADVAAAYEVPLHAARQVAADIDVPMVGGTYAMTRDVALDLGEELDARGWALGPMDDEDEQDDDEDESEDDDT